MAEISTRIEDLKGWTQEKDLTGWLFLLLLSLRGDRQGREMPGMFPEDGMLRENRFEELKNEEEPLRTGYGSNFDDADDEVDLEEVD